MPKLHEGSQREVRRNDPRRLWFGALAAVVLIGGTAAIAQQVSNPATGPGVQIAPQIVPTSPKAAGTPAAPPRAFVQIPPEPATPPATVIFKYGVGGYSTSYGLGPEPTYDFNGLKLPSLSARIVARFGATVKVQGFHAWTDDLRSAMNAAPGKVVLIGYSCGASQVPVDATRVKRMVDVVIGIQASVYCGGNIIPANVSYALEVYNPNCLMTGGLGCRRYEPGTGFHAGNLRIVERYDLHPSADLDPDAHADVIEELNIVLASTPRAMLGDNSPNVMRRTSTWRH